MYQKTAQLSPDEKYRYSLQRWWGAYGKDCLFIMLNPSTADALEDDATIRRCVNFAKSWGCCSLYVLNLFAYRATDRGELKRIDDPIGPENIEYFKVLVPEACLHTYTGRQGTNAGPCVVAWGNDGKYLDQDQAALGWIEEWGVQPMCLGINQNDTPKHPLYVPKDAALVPFGG